MIQHELRRPSEIGGGLIAQWSGDEVPDVTASYGGPIPGPVEYWKNGSYCWTTTDLTTVQLREAIIDWESFDWR